MIKDGLGFGDTITSRPTDQANLRAAASWPWLPGSLLSLHLILTLYCSAPAAAETAAAAAACAGGHDHGTDGHDNTYGTSDAEQKLWNLRLLHIRRRSHDYCFGA